MLSDTLVAEVRTALHFKKDSLSAVNGNGSIERRGGWRGACGRATREAQVLSHLGGIVASQHQERATVGGPRGAIPAKIYRTRHITTE